MKNPVYISIIGLLSVIATCHLDAQAQPAEREYGAISFAVNPAHIIFGHATFYLDFFNKSGKHSFRTMVSAGINGEKEDYNWAAGFHFKTFYPGHHVNSAGWFAPGVLLSRTSYIFNDPFLIRPQIIGGWHFALNKWFYLAPEAGIGAIWTLDSNYKPDHPFEILLGLTLGIR